MPLSLTHIPRLSRHPMNKTRKGFTLIELLIAVVIIGILAATAIPKWADTKQKAYVTAMKSDLRNMVHAGEAYFSENGTYVGFTPMSSLKIVGPSAPTGSSGVTIVMGTVTAMGWSATATHVNTETAMCEIGVGDGKPVGLAEGEPGGTACR